VYGRETEKTLADRRGLAAALVGGLTVAALAADSGGFDATSWGWSTIALLIVAGVALLAGARRLTPLEWALPAGLAALAAWTWLSLAWSSDFSQTIQEGERMLLYVAATATLLLLGRRSGVETLVASLAAAITGICAYALAWRTLAPGRGAHQIGAADQLAGFRLARPLGYANALAIFAAIGILLALGLALRGRTPWVRALASSALVILAPTLYFTYGRGAWVGLFVGLVAAAVAERDRLEVLARSLALAVLPAVAVVLASRTHELTSSAGSVAAARHDGHRVAVAVVVLAAAAAFVPAALDRVGRRISIGRSGRRAFAVALALVGLAVVVAALAAVGGPAAAAHRAYHAFNAPTPVVTSDTSGRLFSLSGSNRSNYWRVAWREVEAHPLLGGGAGSFQRYWLRHRSQDLPVLDAHSLYLETLAELGPVGLALLLCALAVPLLALRDARRVPLAAAALGAYVAFLVHAAIDWDWEMPAVTLAGLACGVVLLLAARGAEEPRLGRAPRGVGVAVAVLVGLVAVVGYVGNRAEASAADALDASRLQAAAADARHAKHWEPWSPVPWRLLGESQLQSGRVDEARASFRRGLATDSASWELWFDLALTERGPARRAALARVAALDPFSSELAQLRGSG